MSVRLTRDLGPAARAAYDAIIDVRSPGEFAEDHIPGAVNLPVLDDAERAIVGTMFIQESKFLARKLGAALVARNIARHLEETLADRDGSFRPLVYCWRGGQRSGAMVTVMDQVGWSVTQLEGGYQTWRRQVAGRLYPDDAGAGIETPALNLVLLDGPTGSGKTETLAMLAARGIRTLDLEALAAHRGSLFGGLRHGQPSQKLFESRLYTMLEALDAHSDGGPIVVEAESSRIGRLTLPPLIWSAMKVAPRITLTATPEDRAAHIVATYGDIAADHAGLDAALTRLPPRLGRETLAWWRRLAREGRIPELVGELLESHYDPAYRRMASRYECALTEVPAPIFAGTEAERASCLEQIEAAIAA